MNETLLRQVDCPYCGEAIEIVIDPSIDGQEYIEDCSVCCRPMQIDVHIEGGDVRVAARDENEP